MGSFYNLHATCFLTEAIISEISSALLHSPQNVPATSAEQSVATVPGKRIPGLQDGFNFFPEYLRQEHKCQSVLSTGARKIRQVKAEKGQPFSIMDTEAKSYQSEGEEKCETEATEKQQ